MAHGDDEGHAALDPFHNEGDEFLLFSFGEEMAFRGVGQCDETVDTAIDTELDEPFLTGVVDGAGFIVARGKYGEYAFEFHMAIPREKAVNHRLTRINTDGGNTGRTQTKNAILLRDGVASTFATVVVAERTQIEAGKGGYWQHQVRALVVGAARHHARDSNERWETWALLASIISHR